MTRNTSGTGTRRGAAASRGGWTRSPAAGGSPPSAERRSEVRAEHQVTGRRGGSGLDRDGGGQLGAGGVHEQLVSGRGEREHLVAQPADSERLPAGLGDAPALGDDLGAPTALGGADAARQDAADPAVGDEVG